MSINIIDIFWFYISRFQSSHHCTLCTITIRCRSSHMISITTHTITDNLCINMSTTSLSMFIFFQYDNTRTFTHNKAIPIFIPRTTCFLWFIISLRKSFSCAKSCNSHRIHSCFCTTCNHNISFSSCDNTSSITNSMSSSCTSCHNSMVWSLKTIFNRNMT